jgi:hypothetical protein
MREMTFQSVNKFLPSSSWFLGSLEFITDKFGDLTLQDPGSCEVVGSCTGHLPPDPARVELISEAHLGHGLNKLGEMDSDLAWDKADHTLAASAATTDPIYQSSSESDYESNGEVCIVGQGDPPQDKTTEEIQREVEEEMG